MVPFKHFIRSLVSNFISRSDRVWLSVSGLDHGLQAYHSRGGGDDSQYDIKERPPPKFGTSMTPMDSMEHMDSTDLMGCMDSMPSMHSMDSMSNNGLHGLHGLIAKNLIGKYCGRRCIVGEAVWGRSEVDWQGVAVEDVILEKLFWGRCILQL